jgi:hypothetical protein
MRLEDRITAAIRAQVDDAPLWPPDLDAIRRAARGQVRRRAAVVVSGLAAAAVVVATVLGLGGGLPDRSSTPVDRPGVDRRDDDRRSSGVVRTDDAGVVMIPRVREETVVVSPEVTSEAFVGRRLVESLSSEDPTYDGSGELSVGLDPDRELMFSATCDGAPQAYLVAVIEPRATYFNSERCDGEGMMLPLEVDSAATMRLFVIERSPREFRRCFTYSPPGGCDAVEPPHVADEVGARFGLRLVENRRGPVAARMLDDEVYARVPWGGSIYSLDAVAAGATGASLLSFRVPASDQDRIAWATIGAKPALQRCYARAGESESCLPTVEVSVDGQRPIAVPDLWPFGPRRGWGSLVAGEGHVITMRVVDGNPRHIDLGAWIYEKD